MPLLFVIELDLCYLAHARPFFLSAAWSSASSCSSTFAPLEGSFPCLSACRVGGSLFVCSALASLFSCFEAWSSLLEMDFWSFESWFRWECSIPCS